MWQQHAFFLYSFLQLVQVGCASKGPGLPPSAASVWVMNLGSRVGLDLACQISVYLVENLSISLASTLGFLLLNFGVWLYHLYIPVLFSVRMNKGSTQYEKKKKTVIRGALNWLLVKFSPAVQILDFWSWNANVDWLVDCLASMKFS